MLVFLSGCKGGRPNRLSAHERESANSIVFALGNDISNMDPSLMNDIESAQVANQVYQGLVQFKADSVEVESCLADRWTSSPDGLTWSFHLRKGVKFSDGSPVNADSVVFSVMRQLDDSHPFHVQGKMRYAKFLFGDRSSTETELVRDVTARDEETVVFRLARPYPPFLKNMAMTQASIVNPKTVRTMANDFNTTMVGTGPFLLKQYQRDQRIDLVRNPNYWGPKAKLDEVQFRVLRDPNTRLNSVRRGDTDIITGIEPNTLKLLEEDKNITVLSEPSLNLGYISLNNKKPPFDNRKVRLALNYAIDRRFIVSKLFMDTSVEATGIIPPGMIGYDPARKGFPYDPEKARQLLKEAGYPNGFTVTFSTHDRARIYNPVGVKLAERIQQNLAKVGITAKIDQMEFPTFLAKEKAHDYTMANSGWVSDNGDPDNFIYELTGREDNDALYSNPAATALMREAASEGDEQKRAGMYEKVEQMLREDPPFIPINNAKQILAARNRVKNVKLHPTGVMRLDAVYVDAPSAQ
jgi:peptide/nickel transport system substrate-binding protein